MNYEKTGFNNKRNMCVHGFASLKNYTKIVSK